VGVVLQSVKEVLLGMVADDLVHEDRIGASKYYWAFPSEHATKVRRRQRATHCARSPATGRLGGTLTCCKRPPYSRTLASRCLCWVASPS